MTILHIYTRVRCNYRKILICYMIVHCLKSLKPCCYWCISLVRSDIYLLKINSSEKIMLLLKKKKLFYMIFGISDILINFFELIHFIHICKLSLNMINQKCIPVVRVLGPLQPVDTSHTFLLQSHSPWHLSYDTI